MIEKKPALIGIVVAALLLVSVPSVLFHNAVKRYFSFLWSWNIGAIRPSRNGAMPPMRNRSGRYKADLPPPEIKFVKFAVKLKRAREVKMSGDFNKWDRDNLQLVKTGADTWETILPLAPGRYKYLYLIDGQTVLDPLNPDIAFNNGEKTSLIIVK